MTPVAFSVRLSLGRSSAPSSAATRSASSPGLEPRAKLLPGTVERSPDRGHDQRPAVLGNERRDALVREQAINGRQLPKRVSGHGRR